MIAPMAFGACIARTCHSLSSVLSRSAVSAERSSVWLGAGVGGAGGSSSASSSASLTSFQASSIDLLTSTRTSTASSGARSSAADRSLLASASSEARVSGLTISSARFTGLYNTTVPSDEHGSCSVYTRKSRSAPSVRAGRHARLRLSGGRTFIMPMLIPADGATLSRARSAAHSTALSGAGAGGSGQAAEPVHTRSSIASEGVAWRSARVSTHGSRFAGV
mmetsp:Transcript_29708/g.96780  ORF Transcript_29708/g.96780 Transcript_29708/m.96780 type:complete len:221 (-) Transcript_29708:267-929(-)